MAVDFEIKFSDIPALQCELHNTSLAHKYLKLLKQQYAENPTPIFRDPQKYDLPYFKELVTEAKTVLGWEWQRDHYDVSVTTTLHKDIEQYLARGYENIPEEHDNLLNELHFCLHAIESGSRRDNWLQIEWFNDAGFDIGQDEYPGKLTLEFGDLRLQNPYVGHHPLYVYEQQDSINVMQTCRFHDFAKPGLNLVIAKNKNQSTKFDWKKYINWFETHANDFVSMHGAERIEKFTGHPIVGSIINKEDLQTLIDQPVIKFESITFA